MQRTSCFTFCFAAPPLAGWAYSSAAGFPVVYFGLWQLPDWVPRSVGLATNLKLVHQMLTSSLASLVELHMLAAFKHDWLDHNGLLSRMNLVPKRHWFLVFAT